MSGQSLAGLRILVTRERQASEEFARRLSDLGAFPIICPAIQIVFRHPPGLDLALLGLGRFDWLVLTSANAVRAVGYRLDELGLDPEEALGQTRIAVVGQATGATLEKLGGRAELVASSGSAAGLADDLVAAGVFETIVLFPASRVARPDLPQRLREAGAGVVQLAVYDTVAPDRIALPDQSSLDVATFTSPSAVRNALGAADAVWLQAVPMICIGETTAAAARAAGALDVTVAADASMDGIIRSLLEFQQRRQQEG